MKKIENKALYLLKAGAIGLGIGIFISLIIPIGIIGAILLGLAAILIAQQDTVVIPINHRATYKNRWNQELENGYLKEGVYWTTFFTYILEETIDASKNEFKITVEGETSNTVTISLTASLWTKVVDPVKYQRIGMDDARNNILADWEDTLKAFIRTKTDKDLASISNKGIDPKSLIQGDTLFTKTIPETGMEFVSSNIGQIDLPQDIKDANKAATIAKREADAEDFKNREVSKKVNLIFTEALLNFINPATTTKKLRLQALKNLNLSATEKYSHEVEYEISEEMLAIAKSKTRLSAAKLSKMQSMAEESLNVREGRTQDHRYKGLSGNKTYKQI